MMEQFNVMSRGDVDIKTLEEIAEECRLPPCQIEDIYSCTPQQFDWRNRAEMHHIILSFDSSANIDQWLEAMRHVIRLNAILRTRLVDCRLGTLQVVTNEEHKTVIRASGNIEDYLLGEGSAELIMGSGKPLFRSAFIGRKFVASMHHSMMDYWGINTFLSDDVSRVYLKQPLPKRPAFKEFVARIREIDGSAADAFWKARFKGIPSVFPALPCGVLPLPSGKVFLQIPLEHMEAISPSHLPLYVEAAWVLTACTYTDSVNVVYGTVVSGRSPLLNGLQANLGPTVVEVPVQAILRRNMTIGELIRDRASSARGLKNDPILLQYGLSRIGAVSEAARVACDFQAVINIVPPQAPTVVAPDKVSSSIKLERTIWHAENAPSFHMLCRILESELSLEVKHDPRHLTETQSHRVLNQFQHFLRALTKRPVHTKLNELAWLSEVDRLQIERWNSDSEAGAGDMAIETTAGALAAAGFRYGDVLKVPKGYRIWIVSLQDVNEVVSIGRIGEMVIESPKPALDTANHPWVQEKALILRPQWAGASEFHFYRPRELARYDSVGQVLYMGKLINRQKLCGHQVQLEELESTVRMCTEVRAAVLLTMIHAGRTQLVAVVCLTDFPSSEPGVIREVSETSSGPADLAMEKVVAYMKQTLPSFAVPDRWWIVEDLPRAGQELDRAAVKDWVKAKM